MVTNNNNSWSLGATPNKSLDQPAVFIRSHSPSDLCDVGQSARLHLKNFASCANFADVGFSFGCRIFGTSDLVCVSAPALCQFVSHLSSPLEPRQSTKRTTIKPAYF